MQQDRRGNNPECTCSRKDGVTESQVPFEEDEGAEDTSDESIAETTDEIAPESATEAVLLEERENDDELEQGVFTKPDEVSVNYSNQKVRYEFVENETEKNTTPAQVSVSPVEPEEEQKSVEQKKNIKESEVKQVKEKQRSAKSTKSKKLTSEQKNNKRDKRDTKEVGKKGGSSKQKKGKKFGIKSGKGKGSSKKGSKRY